MRRLGTFRATLIDASAPWSILLNWLCAALLDIGPRVGAPRWSLGANRTAIRTAPAGHLAGLAVLALLLVTSASTLGLAAPITGSNQAVPATDAERAPPVAPNRPGAAADASATVIEFSVLPSADDPTRMETIVILQQGGGRTICVNLKSTDVIVRSYRKRGDEPFAPAVPGDIRGLTSGDTGSLIGFNETSVFIRPHTIDDEFTNQNECFIAGEAEGCFLPDEEDCDQRLEEGEVACVLGTISRVGCSLLDHASLSRQMRIFIVLNQPPGEEPIITAADIAQAPEIIVTPEEPGADLPTGPAPAGPTAEAPPEGSAGGEDLVIVPDVVGLSVPVGIRLLTNARLTVGTVVVTRQFSALDDLFISSAWAFTCLPEPELCDNPGAKISSQDCVPNTLVPPSTVCNLTAVLLVTSPDIPEPSSLALFATGLGLLILMTWWRRRRLG